MGTLSALYQDLILDHNRSPRNYRLMENANRRVEGNNPLCGDRLTIWLRMEGDLIQDAAFQGSGCAISRASASLMTTAVKGKTRAEAEALFQRFHRLVTGSVAPAEAESLGKLAAI
jgi:nitrogen fixation NifU-like protein